MAVAASTKHVNDGAVSRVKLEVGQLSNRPFIGFMVLDNLAKRLKVRLRVNSGLKSTVSKKGDLILAKPSTYMNLSGSALSKIKDRFRLSLGDILVVCDDLNLPLGKIRLRQSGGSGGHNGLSSIIAFLGSEQFCRLRIGIGRPQNPGYDPSSFVLEDFKSRETKTVEEAVELAADCCLDWLEGDISKTMSKFNRN